MNKDFEILIGVNLEEAESDIKGMINYLGTRYKLQLEAELNIDKTQISNIAKVLKSLGSIHIDSNLDEITKDAKEFSKQAEKAVQKVDNAMEGLTKETKDFVVQNEKAIDSAEKLLKVNNKTQNKKNGNVKTQTQVSGNEFATQKNVLNTTGDIPVLNTQELTQDIKKLDKYISNVENNIKSWSVASNGAKSEIKELQGVLATLKDKFKIDPFGDFENDLNKVKKLESQIEDINKKEIQALAKKKSEEEALEKIAKERVKWQGKINDLEREGYTHNGQMNALKKRLNALTDEELKDLQKVDKILEEMNAQYAKALTYQKNLKAQVGNGDKVQSARNKVSNLDANLIGQTNMDKITGKVDKLSDFKDAKTQKVLVRDINKLYEELLILQSESIAKKKLEAQQEKERKAIHEHLAQMEKQTRQEQIKLDQQAHDRQVQHWQREQAERDKLANQIADKRESRSSGNSSEELKEANRLREEAIKDAQKHNSEQDKQRQNQQRINASLEEFESSMRQIEGLDLFDQQDLNSAYQMIGKLSKESNELEKELKAIRAEFARVNKEVEKRQGAQSGVNIKNNANQYKADQMMDRNIVPEHLISNFKELSNSLNFKSSAEDIAHIATEYDKLIRLEAELKNERKDSERYARLIHEAEQNSSTVLARHQQKLEEISYNMNRQLKDTGNVAEAQARINALTERANELKARGVRLTEEEQQELNNSVRDINRMITGFRDAEREVARIESRTERLNETIRAQGDRATRGFERNRDGARELNETRNTITADADRLRTSGLSGEAYEAEVRRIEEAMRRLNARSRELRDQMNRDSNSIMGRFARAMRQVPVYMSAMSIFYGSITLVKKGFESLLDIDKAMVGLSKVTEATSSELENFQETASKIGMNLGVVTADVINATTEFQKLGYSLQQASTLAQNSIIYANVGDMNVEDATSYIVSAVKGFNVEVDKAGNNIRSLVDMFNEVSNNYAITSAGIGTALTRSSAVLNQAGNSIEQSVALVTSANTTIQDPMKVGNALKTISMRLRGVDDEGKKVATLIPELEREFNSFGASIMEDEDTFKSTYDIMQTLSDNWENLTDVQKAYMTELIGGKEQGSIVASMMQNWADAVGSYETALNSSGSAQREFNAFTESFEYKIGQLKVAVEGMWMAIMDDDAIKSLIDGLTVAVELLTALINLVGAPALLTGLATMFGLMTSSSLRNAFFKPQDVTAFRERMTAIMASADTTFGRVRGRASQAGEAIGFLAKRLLPLLAITMGVTFVVSKAIEVIKREETARKNTIKTLDDQISKYQELEDRMKSVNVNEYMKLDEGNSNGTLNTEEYEKYANIQSDIIENMPELISHYDEHGKAIIRDSDSIRDLLATKKEMYEADLKARFEVGVEDADFGDLEDAIEKTRKAMDRSNFAIEEEEAYSFVKQWLDKNVKDFDGSEEELKAKFTKFNSEIDGLIKDSNPNKLNVTSGIKDALFASYQSGDTNQAVEFIDKQIKQVREKTSDMSAQVAKSKVEVNNFIGDFATLLDDGFRVHLNEMNIATNSNDYLFIEKIKESLKENVTELGENGITDILNNIPEYIAGALEAVKAVDLNMSDLIAPNLNVDEINANFKKIIGQFDKNTDYGQGMIRMLQMLRKEHLKTAQSMNSQKIESFSFAEDVAPIIDEFSNEISGLDSAYRQLADGQQLSINQIFDLIKQYPQLSKEVVNHNGTLQLSKKAIMELAKIKEAEFKQDLATKKAQMEASRQKARNAVYNILLEAKAIKTLGDINAKVIQKEITAKSKVAQLDDNRALGFSKFGADALAKSTANNQNKKDLALLKENYAVIANVEAELGALEALMNVNYSSSLGNIGSISTSKDKADKKEAEKKELTDMIYVADKYAQTINRLNSAIAIQQSKQEGLAKYSSGYIASMKEERKLTEEKKKAVDAEIASLEKQIKTKKIVQKGLITLGQEDNKTARAKQAELQQELDEMRNTIYTLNTESADLMNRMKSISFEIINASAELYNNQRNALSDDISYMDYMMSMYDSSSKNYEKYATTKIGYLKQIESFHKKEGDFLLKEKETNKNLTEAQKEELNELIRQSRIALYGANKAVFDAVNELDNIKVDGIFETFEREMEEYSKAISKIREDLKYVDDVGYSGQIESLNEVLALTKGQHADMMTVVVYLREMKKQYSGNHEMVAKITSELEKWESEMKNTSTTIKDVKKEISELYETMAEEFVENYKENLELLKEADEKAHSEMMENAEKTHEKKMSQYEDELEMLREIYNQKMQEIDRDDSTRSYENELTKLRKEAQEIQKQIDKLSLDDSFKAESQRSDLSKKLADINEQIVEHDYEREKELRKQSLEDGLAEDEKAMGKKQDIYDEEYNKWLEMEEKKHKESQNYFDMALQDEKKFSEMREEVLKGSFINIADEMRQWQVEVGGSISQLGDVVVNNFTTKITEAIKEFSKLSKLSIGSLDDSHSTEYKGLNATAKTPNETANVGTLANQSGAPSSSPITGNTTGGKPIATATTGGGNTGGGNTGATTATATATTAPAYKRSGTVKKVKVTSDVWLYKNAKATASEKVRLLKKGEMYNMYGEYNGMYDLGGGWSSKSSLTIVSTTSTASTSTSTSPRYYTIKKGDTMGALATNYYGSSAKWTKIRDANPTVNPNSMKIGTKLLIPFRSGGYTGDWSGNEGKVALLHKKEQVLNADQTEGLFEAIKSFERIKKISVSNSSNIKTQNNNTGDAVPVVNNEYNLTLEIASMNGDKKSADIVSEQILQNMKRTKGGRF